MPDVNEVALYGLTAADDRFVMYTGSTAANINNKIITGDVRHNDADFAAMVSTGTVDTMLGKATFNADGTITFALAADAATRMGNGTGPVKDFVTYEYEDSNHQIHQKVLEIVVVRDPAGKWDSPDTVAGETQQLYVNINSGSNAALTQGLTQGDDTLRGSFYLANTNVDFGGGDDVLQLTNAPHNTLNNSVVDMGDGNNLVEITAITQNIGGYLYSSVMYQSSLTTGAGDDTLTLVGNGGHHMFWNSCLNTGAGNDSVSLISNYAGSENVVIGHGGAVNIDLGTGNDTLFVSATAARDGAVRSCTANVTIDSGSGDDNITIQSPTLAIGNDYWDTSLSLHSGNGNDTITLAGGIQGFSYASRGKTVVDLGADDDALTLTSTGTTSAITNATVLGGAGNDTMRITSAAALSGAVVNGDDGNDLIRINTGAAMVNTAINGGAGADFVRLEHTVLQGTVVGAGTTLSGGTDEAGDLIARPAGDGLSHSIGDVLSLNRNLSIDSHGNEVSASGTGTFNFGGITTANATQFEALHLDYTGGTGRDMIDIDSVLAGITAKGLDCAMKSLVFTGDSADRYTLPAGWTREGMGISLAGFSEKFICYKGMVNGKETFIYMEAGADAPRLWDDTTSCPPCPTECCDPSLAKNGTDALASLAAINNILTPTATLANNSFSFATVADAHAWGDAAVLSSETGGKDTISVTTLTSGYIGGDAGSYMHGTAFGGADKLSIATMNGGYMGGDAAELLIGNARGGADIITITTMNGGHAGGDAGRNMYDTTLGGNDSITMSYITGGYVGGDAGNSMYNAAKGGNDTIMLTYMYGSMTGGHIGGDAGYSMDGTAKGGNDTITLTSLNSGYIGGDAGYTMGSSAKGGNDSIGIAAINGGYVGGDAAYTMEGNARGGNDVLTVATMSSGYIGGDAGYSMEGNAQGGNDTFNVTTMKGGYVGGDAGYSMVGDTQGGDDTLTITAMNGGTVSGDAAYSMSGNAQGGDDLITLRTMSAGAVYGDASQLSDSALGGDDTIQVTTLTGTTQKIIDGNSGYDFFSYATAGAVVSLDANGTVTIGASEAQPDSLTTATNTTIVNFEGLIGSKGEDTLNSLRDASLIGGRGNDVINTTVLETGFITGDIQGDYTQSERGDNDLITVGSMLGGLVFGDAAYMRTSAVGGDDTFAITSMQAGLIAGDSATDMISLSKGGNDLFTLGTMSGGTVSGDAGNRLGNNAQGGNDTIRINSLLEGLVVGDAVENMQVSAVGGNDLIVLASMAGGLVAGDAGNLETNSAQGGNDTIQIGTLLGGTVAGDAGVQMSKDALGGHDLITIDTMQSGAVYGDSARVAATTVGGNDTIQVHALTGTEAKVIDGNGGNDLFMYTSDDGHRLTLSESGSVQITSADGSLDVTTQTNTSILNFEGLGGGAGGDILVGNSHDNILLGGLGCDILTGGLGADSFVWGAGDLDGGLDSVTDFSLTQGDTLCLLDILDTSGGAIDFGSLNASASAGSNTLHLDLLGQQGVDVTIQGSLTVQNTTYNSFDDFVSAYESAGRDEAMMQALLQQMVSTGMA